MLKTEIPWKQIQCNLNIIGEKGNINKNIIILYVNIFFFFFF